MGKSISGHMMRRTQGRNQSLENKLRNIVPKRGAPTGASHYFPKQKPALSSWENFKIILRARRCLALRTSLVSIFPALSKRQNLKGFLVHHRLYFLRSAFVHRMIGNIEEGKYVVTVDGKLFQSLRTKNCQCALNNFQSAFGGNFSQEMPVAARGADY